MNSLGSGADSSSLFTQVQWTWGWPPLAIALLLVAAAIWIAHSYSGQRHLASGRTRALLALLRLIAVVLLIVMLGQPGLRRSRVAPPRIALLLDRSASMDTTDVSLAGSSQAPGASAAISRRAAWENIVYGDDKPLLQSLRAQFAVDVHQFDEHLHQPRAEAGGDEPAAASGTRLGDALDAVLRPGGAVRPSAIIVMTDGINTAGASLGDAAARAAMLRVPIFAVALGSHRPRPDVELDGVVAEDVVFPGDRLQIEAALRSFGFAGQHARLVLRRTDTDEELATATATLPEGDQPQSIMLPLIVTEPGPLPLELAVDPQPGEVDLSNNLQQLRIDVRAEPIRALLVDSTPRYEFRALKSLLERDPAIDLRVWLQDADFDWPTVEPAAVNGFPVDEAQLLDYDVLLLGDVDVDRASRSAWESIQRFVSVHGGGLAFIAGDQYMPRAAAAVDSLRLLLPVQPTPASDAPSAALPPEGFAARPTVLGMHDSSMQLAAGEAASAQVWAALPNVPWVLREARLKPGVLVLAESPPAEGDASPIPIIIRRYVGAGEVLFHATDSSWVWRWRNDDRYFARYWGQAVRRLARGRARQATTRLSANRSQYEYGEPVVVRAWLGAGATASDEPLTLTLIGAATGTRETPLVRNTRYVGMFEAELRELPPDRYTAVLAGSDAETGAITAEFRVTAPATELSQLVVNSAGLQAAASETGGRLYTADTARQVLDDLPPPTPTTIEQLPALPLWNRPWVLAAFCLAIGAEWLLRRRAGLL
jgi:hypothetical protein